MGHKSQPEVMTVGHSDLDRLDELLGELGLEMVLIADDQPIPGSYWGETEAGLIDRKLYVRGDTPLHSLLHESCHYLCMDEARRRQLDTDAGGDYDEENAVCYLQILLADLIEGFGRDRCMADMDAWGYTFRLGSARAWFENDAEDARQWLLDREILSPDGQIGDLYKALGLPRDTQ